MTLDHRFNDQNKKTVAMKKTCFLFVAVTMLLAGCAPSNQLVLNTIGTRRSLIDTSNPATLENAGNNGICLPLTSHASVNIDVECILDYVQGDSSLDAEIDANAWRNPWIRFNLSY